MAGKADSVKDGGNVKTTSRWLVWIWVVLIGLLAAGIGWDYGIQKNFGTVVPGKMYRSGQPSEAQLDKWIQEYGFKSILVMRFGVPPYEEELAERYGIKIYHVPFSAAKGLEEGQWETIRQILTDESNLPILVHCHGGGDRSGIVTVLYRVEVQGWPLERALREMNRYYHVSIRYPALQRQLRERFQGGPEEGVAQTAH
jgi:protein tyrosine/serine phosphatase